MSELSSIIFSLIAILFLLWYSKVFQRIVFGTVEFLLLNFLLWILIVFYPVSVALAHVGVFFTHSHTCSTLIFPCSVTTPFEMFLYVLPVLWAVYLGGNFLINSYKTLKSNYGFTLFVKHLPTTEINGRKVRLLPIDKPFLGNFGTLKPVLLVSPTTLEILSEQELESALEHEDAHIRKHHLIKEYILRFFIFWYPSPIRNRTYKAFLTVREIEADNAVSSRVHLASALLKSLSSHKLNLVTGLIGEEPLAKVRIKRLLGLATTGTSGVIKLLGGLTTIALFVLVFFATQHIFADYSNLSKVTEVMCYSVSSACGV